MKFFLTILFISTISYTSIQANVVSIDAFFQKADAFFMKYVKGGLVDYKTLKSKPSDFEELLRLTWNANLTELPPESRKAFWINAYNITCIHAVVKQPNMTSPLDVDGFFTIERHKVAGEYLTLSDIENKKMMDEFKDARLHFVLVCAAKGCPKLANKAYLTENLDAQIETRTIEILDSPEFIRYNLKTDLLEVSEIFNWYTRDFAPMGGTLKYLNKFRTQKIPDSTKVGYYTYDWKLNGQ